MIPVLALLAGFAFGWVRGARAGGNRLDRLQYAAVHGILFAVLGVAAGILAGRFLG